jgi:tetratricopeptide (TPR) repeat protein
MKPCVKLILLLAMIFISPESHAQNARQYFKTGLSFSEAGNFRDAVDQFTRSLEIDPEYLSSYLERARAFEAMNELQKAADDLQRALSFEQKKEALYYEAARLNYLLANYDNALELINRSLELKSNYEPAFRMQCLVLLATGDYSGALISINKAQALKDTPENNFYHGQVTENMKNYDQAESDYLKAISKNNKYTEAYLALASLRLSMNKPEAGMENCNAVIAYEPANQQAYIVRSRIYARLTEYPKAIDDISKILHDNPEDKEMYLLRGTYYQEFLQHQNAISDFSHALIIDNNYVDAYYKRALSYEQAGDTKSAIKDYETLTRLSNTEPKAALLLVDVRKRLFELHRETQPPVLTLLEPKVSADSGIQVAQNKTRIILRGKIQEESELNIVTVNGKPATFVHVGDEYDFAAETDVSLMERITVTAMDVYANSRTYIFNIDRTEINPPVVSIMAPYASDNGEIYLDTDNSILYIEGTVHDESTIHSILIDSVVASFNLNDINPRFSASINVANKNKFTVTATDSYGNDTTQTYVLNRNGVSLLKSNPMGRTWVIFIENSNYRSFPSLEGPAKDVLMMRSALERYDIQKIIYKQDMTKMEMERFFSIELRDLLRTNKVDALLLWYAGHGRYMNETGYWIPVDARRDDEFTYYNLNALRASLQSYTAYVTHKLVITDACESGPTFYQAMRDAPKARNCNDREAVISKSSQVFSSAGYEMATDNSQFTRTFANTLIDNPDACLPIETIVDKVTQAVSQNNHQTPLFGKITGLEDENGTFFFISKQ